MEKEITLLETLGATNIIPKIWVNNHLYKFEYNNNQYTVIHILNIYGESVDLWELYSPDGKTKMFDTLEQAMNFLKEDK